MSSQHWNPISATLLGISLATLLLALGLLARPTTLPKASIAVSRTPLSAPIYIAAAKGYFRAQGVEIELHEVIGGDRSFSLMAEGRADLATSSDSVVMFRSFEHRNFAVLTSFVSSDNDIKLLASTDSHIRTPYDLAHAKSAATPHSSSEYFLHSVALMHGIDTDTLEIVETRPEEMTRNLLERSAIEVLSLWEPHAYQVTEALGEKAVLLATKGLHSTSFNLIALQNTVETKPQALGAVLRALDQAVDFMQRDPSGAKAIIRKQLALEPAFVDWVWPDYNFRLELGQSLLISLDSAARWAIASGAVEPQPLPNFRLILDNRFLRQVVPEAMGL